MRPQKRNQNWILLFQHVYQFCSLWQFLCDWKGKEPYWTVSWVLVARLLHEAFSIFLFKTSLSPEQNLLSVTFSLVPPGVVLVPSCFPIFAATGSDSSISSSGSFTWVLHWSCFEQQNNGSRVYFFSIVAHKLWALRGFKDGKNYIYDSPDISYMIVSLTHLALLLMGSPSSFQLFLTFFSPRINGPCKHWEYFLASLFLSINFQRCLVLFLG